MSAHVAALHPALEASPTLSFALAVSAVRDLGPSLRRITLTGPDLEHFGVNGDLLDVRIKVVIPGGAATGGAVDHLAHLRPGALLEADEVAGWYRRWLLADAGERGVLRTYTARGFRPAGDPSNDGEHAELDVDFVLHVHEEEGRLVGGPASVWAAMAAPGDAVTVLGPNRHLCGPDYAGIEFRPGTAERILLAGDETAVPAICSILESLPAGIAGLACLEVPDATDVQEVRTASEVEVRWLPRGSRPHGDLLLEAVRAAVAPSPELPSYAAPSPVAEEPEEINVDEAILWETTAESRAPFYAWIAGEAGVVKELRRHLVRDAGIDRRQVAFMGYWRQGKAEG
jgi:iron complex transport system ATP-binding protein